MIARLIEFSVRNRWLVIIAWIGITIWGLYAVLHTPVDAIPDLSENQVIVFADWMGRSPQDIEDQITYPLSVQLQGLAGVKAVRSSSEFNFSMINIIFDEDTDFYFARTRVLERLATAQASMPAGVTPYLAPDATALGQIFWYTVEGEGYSLDELRAVQDWTVRYQLNSVPGVAEVASVGGMVREYQVDVDPAKLRVYDLPLSALYNAIASSNMSVGGKVIVQANTEYVIRGVGWLEGLEDLENTVVTSRNGVPIRLKDVATVQLGPEFRRSALEKNGREVVGGVVMMRYGENPLQVTRAIKDRIRELQAGLPEGVRIIPFYDRTRLIESAIHTVTGTLTEEIIIASIAILLILMHFRSAFVVCLTLPLAVLVSFLFMYYLGVSSNIMSLAGIAISIGVLVDAAVVMVENATKELHDHFGGQRVRGDITEIVVRACRLVGRPIFFAVLIMLISFLPVFAFGGQEGKLSHPLAFTKTFAMVGVAVMAVTLVPALIPLFLRGRLRGEEDSWIVRSFIHIYRPMLNWLIDRPVVVIWIMAVIWVLATGFIASPALSRLMLAAGLGALLVSYMLFGTWRKGLIRQGVPILAIVVIALWAGLRFPKLGGEFMPELNEGSIMDMPTSAPRISMSQAIDDVMVRDRLMRTLPEVEQVVGKVGRAETSTDPSPVDMVETVITLHPKQWWPKRKIAFDDALRQGGVIAADLQRRGYLTSDRIGPDDWDRVVAVTRDPKRLQFEPDLAPAAELLNTAVSGAVETFDRSMRELARRRQLEYAPIAARELVSLVYDRLIEHVRTLPGEALLRDPTDHEREQIIGPGVERHGAFIGELPRQEEVDRLLALMRQELIDRGIVAERDDLLLDRPNAVRDAFGFVKQALGGSTPGFSERLFLAIEQARDDLWAERTKKLNWELFDYGIPRLNELISDAILRSAVGSDWQGQQPDADALASLRKQWNERLAGSVFLWQKTKDDVLKEMDSELQMPGWGNAWTQPIINRVNMLATGVRTQIGVKVFGPTGKSLEESIADVQRVSNEIAAKLKTLDGAVDVVADQAVGKRYLEIDIDREKAARYGVNMADLAEAVETAMGGNRITQTVEGRQRFPVRLRYARDHWQDPEAIGDVLITARTTPAQLLAMPDPAGGAGAPAPQSSAAAGGSDMTGGMGGSMGGGASAGAMGTSAAAPMSRGSASGTGSISAATGGQLTQIPLRMVADIRIVEGPSMIKSENGRLRNYVTLNVRDRDIVGFVEEARQAIKPIEAQLAGTGMSIEWSGEFEHQVRARQTMAVIFPLVIVAILFLLYMTFHDGADTFLVFLAVIGALCGSLMFQALFGFNFSIVVSIGYVAAFGMATETGVIMLVYLREAIDKRGGLAAIRSIEELRSAVMDGAVHRMRPKLLTEGTAILGLVPMLWATGTGAEIMRPMAAPVLGGLLIADEVIDVMIPVLFYWIRRRRWQKLHQQTPETAPEAEPALQPAMA